jgi:hypothetical protein
MFILIRLQVHDEFILSIRAAKNIPRVEALPNFMEIPYAFQHVRLYYVS